MRAPTHEILASGHLIAVRSTADGHATITVTQPGGRGQQIEGVDLGPLLKGGLSEREALTYVARLVGHGVDGAEQNDRGHEIPVYRAR